MSYKNRTKVILTAVVLAAFFSCKSDSDVLARYKYGVITRGEYNRRASSEGTSAVNAAIVESLCVEGIARHEAIASGFDKNETYLLRRDRGNWPVIKKIVIEKTRPAVRASWEYVRCRHIAFRGGESPESKKEAHDNAKNVIALLDSGARFDSLTKSYSRDPKNAVAMSTVYAVRGGESPEFENAAFSLAVGAYTTEPVVLPDGTAIVIIADEKETLTLDNLEEEVESGRERKRISAMLEETEYDRCVALIEKNNAASFKAAALPDDDAALLFTVSGKDYTVKDLKKRRDLLSGIVREPIEHRPFLFGLAKEWYYFELFSAEAAKKGYLKDAKLVSVMKSAADFILANEYIRHVCEKEISISERDMIDEYSRNSNNYMKMPEGKSKKPVQLSYPEARMFVKKNMMQARVSQKMEEWKKRALADSGFVIVD